MTINKNAAGQGLVALRLAGNWPFNRYAIFSAGLLSFMLLAGSCKKQSGSTTTDDDHVISSVAKTIKTSGDSITLPQVAAVYFNPGSFSGEFNCRLFNSNHPAIQSDLDIAQAVFGMSDRFQQEIRINTGRMAPQEKVTVDIYLSDAFIVRAGNENGLRAYAKLFVDHEDERTEHFEAVDTRFLASEKILRLELSPEYFSNKFRQDGAYEAIVSAGISPGVNFSEGRNGNSDCTGGIFIRCPLNTCEVTSPFNPQRLHPVTGVVTPHRGVDFRAPVGTPVVAASDGVVIRSGNNFDPVKKTGWGNYIIIEHKNTSGQRFATLYAHLDKITVSSGPVSEGQQIGLSGKTGGVSGPHLHFEYITNANIGNREARVDPEPFINTTSPRLQSAVGSILSVNGCSGGTRTSWNVRFTFKDPANQVNSGGDLIFQDIAPVTNAPYSVPVNLLNANNGVVSSPIFCARWGEYTYFKVKVFIRLANGRESNCIYFNLPKPTGAFRAPGLSQGISGSSQQ